MADYAADGNRWTAVFLARPLHGRGDYDYIKMPWELCRFNADVYPSTEPVVVPCGEENITFNASNVKRGGKIYERIWIVDEIPFRPGIGGKVYFGNPE